MNCAGKRTIMLHKRKPVWIELIEKNFIEEMKLQLGL